MEGWTRISPLEFEHKEMGRLFRDERGDWVQVFLSGRAMRLKSDSLKDALVESDKMARKELEPVPEKKPRKTRVAKPGKKKKPVVKVAKKAKKIVKAGKKAKKSKVTTRSKSA